MKNKPPSNRVRIEQIEQAVTFLLRQQVEISKQLGTAFGILEKANLFNFEDEEESTVEKQPETDISSESKGEGEEGK